MKKVLLTLVVFLLGIQHMPLISHAEESMAYSVKANIPENQINKTLTYFDLKMDPNQKQEITLTVSNSSDEKATILITPNVAMTNQNGVIDYSQSKAKVDSSLKNPLTSIISPKQEVALEPKEKKEVAFTLQMPEKSFDGKILGGFYITKKEEDTKGKETDKNVQIKNKYSYVIGLQIRENTNEVKSAMKMNQIKPALLNYRTALTANLQNTEATIMKDLSVDAKVMKKGSTTAIHETSKKNLSMAPNSNFDFPINWDNKTLEPGKYTLQLVAKSNADEWKFEEDFEITSKESKSLNEEAVELEKAEPNWLLIILSVVGIVLILLALIGFLIYYYQKKKAAEKRARMIKKRKRKQAEEKKRKNTSRKIGQQYSKTKK